MRIHRDGNGYSSPERRTPGQKRSTAYDYFAKRSDTVVALDRETTRDESAIVLVVDDDDNAREVLAQILRDEGFHVRSARDGVEALGLAALPPRPVAMLLDLSMPRMGGGEVLRRLRARRDLASIPVCIVSGDNDVPPGANLAVRKPLFVHRLVRVLSWLRECARQRPAVGYAT